MKVLTDVPATGWSPLGAGPRNRERATLTIEPACIHALFRRTKFDFRKPETYLCLGNCVDSEGCPYSQLANETRLRRGPYGKVADRVRNGSQNAAKKVRCRRADSCGTVRVGAIWDAGLGCRVPCQRRLRTSFRRR